MKHIKFIIKEELYFELHEVMSQLKASTYKEFIQKIVQLYKEGVLDKGESNVE